MVCAAAIRPWPPAVARLRRWRRPPRGTDAGFPRYQAATGLRRRIRRGRGLGSASRLGSPTAVTGTATGGVPRRPARCHGGSHGAGRAPRQSARAGGACPEAVAFSSAIKSGIIARRLGSRLGKPGEDRLDTVQRRQNLADHIRRGGQLAVAQLAQYVLGRVRDPLQPRQAQKAAGALDRVHHAENQRQRAGIGRRTAPTPAERRRVPPDSRWFRSKNRQADRP